MIIPQPDTMATPTSRCSVKVRNPLQEASHYVRTHFHEKITPGKIARVVYVSVPHLNKIFRREMDVSPMQFVTQCRIEAACVLLKDSPLGIARIGALTGFSSASHFSHVFRRVMGTSPLAYRQQRKNG